MGSNRIQGLTIEINGETTALDKALSGVNKTSKDLQSELRSVEKLLKLDPTNTELLAQKQTLLAQAVGNAKEKLDTLKVAAEQAAEKLANGEIGEEQYRALQREVVAAEQQLAKLEGQAGDTGDELKDAGDDAEDAGEQAADGGANWEKLGNTLGTVGAAAGVAVAALAAAATAAAGALVSASKSGAAYADDVLTLSTQTGIATDTLQEYKYAAELVDVSTETLTKSMAKNIKSMKAVQDGTALSVEAYDKLGVSVQNADGSLRDGQEVYWEVIDALGEMENETERDAIAMQILGKSAQELNPLIEAGSETMQELAAKASDAGYVLSGDTLDAFGEFDDQLQYLTVGAEAAQNALGTILLPVLTELATDGVDLLGEFTRGVNDANGDIGAIGDVIGKTLSSLVNKIIERLPEIIEAGMSIISALGRGLMDNLPMIIAAALEIINMLATGLLDALPEIITAALEIVLALALGIADALPELIPAVVETVLTIVETLVNNIDLLVDAAIAIIMALATGLIDALPKLMTKVPEIVIKLVEAIIENAPKLLAAAGEIIEQLITGLVEGWGEILSKVAGWIDDSIIQPIKNTISNFVKIGGDLIAGVWKGISDKAQWLWDQVSGFFSSLTDKIKGFFGISSPSKLMAEMGGFISEGFAQGILENADMVANAVDGINSAVTSSLDKDLEAKVNYATSRSSVAEDALGGAGVADAVGSALLAGLSMIADMIFDAIPKSTTVSLNGRTIATETWGDFEQVGIDKNKIFAASREAMVNIARSVI